MQVLIWDVLDNVTSDYKLLFKQRISFTTVVYFVSRQVCQTLVFTTVAYAIFWDGRIGSLGYVIASNIFESECGQLSITTAS